MCASKLPVLSTSHCFHLSTHFIMHIKFRVAGEFEIFFLNYILTFCFSGGLFVCLGGLFQFHFS